MEVLYWLIVTQFPSWEHRKVSKFNYRGAPYSLGPEQPLVSRGGLLGIILTQGELSIQLHNLVFRASYVRAFPMPLWMHSHPFHWGLFVSRAASTV